MPRRLLSRTFAVLMHGRSRQAPARESLAEAQPDGVALPQAATPDPMPPGADRADGRAGASVGHRMADLAASFLRHPLKRRKRRLYRMSKAQARIGTDMPAQPPARLKEAPQPEAVPSELPRSVEDVVLDPYLTIHPDLEGEEPLPLDIAVSVIIPTYDAGPEFIYLLRKLTGQKGLRSVEIVIVDSGSRDTTAATAAAYGCTLVSIDQSEFSHSHARNLGAAAARGDYLVFMVQDAFPIGDHWLYGLVRCLIDHRQSGGLAALSCAEYPRSDSELFYDVLLKTHYDFIGCSEGDRLGRHTGEDHVSLRSQGQLSDVACAIPKVLFDAYRYQGDYAEDLTLGVRLIRDGHRVAMLSSIRVIHSHTRPVQYFLRRSFVDVHFLAGVFPDFLPPPSNGLAGSLAAAAVLSRLRPDFGNGELRVPSEALAAFVDRVRRTDLPDVPDERWDGFGFPPLQRWLDDYSSSSTPGSGTDPVEAALVRASFEQTRAMFAHRLESLGTVLEAYTALDETVRRELTSAIDKTLAMTVGSQFAFCCIAPPAQTGPGDRKERLEALRDILTAGI
ncbi:glycosyltransferase family 2 protein [Aquibium microcysteis]|uniref:glycosyltransferase family 2 protein n=1 Tax=Aquibium microcysteis TaxID=675281 RepID=UPI00165D2889|nr:glycosyltransferase family A protein [Aquibium microcysteis]